MVGRLIFYVSLKLLFKPRCWVLILIIVIIVQPYFIDLKLIDCQVFVVLYIGLISGYILYHLRQTVFTVLFLYLLLQVNCFGRLKFGLCWLLILFMKVLKKIALHWFYSCKFKFIQPDYAVPRLPEIYRKPLSWGHLAITDEMLVPKGVHYRGVPLYIGSSIQEPWFDSWQLN